MKYLVAGTLALALSGTAALAGGYDEPVMEPEVTTTEPQTPRDTIMADTAAGGSHDIIVPLTALVLFGAALAN
ncbi:hypothetical protein [Vannielia sp.]|uniref:hypothetical protein n=1 Tax=Vannielia sp. TaxID=2813045 RepID=UPI002611BD76|nr:hypothetical protein [Vannielia sp.]MDF1872677.1 hypothetical protein [Vannielia sp.]